MVYGMDARCDIVSLKVHLSLGVQGQVDPQSSGLVLQRGQRALPFFELFTGAQTDLISRVEREVRRDKTNEMGGRVEWIMMGEVK